MLNDSWPAENLRVEWPSRVGVVEDLQAVGDALTGKANARYAAF
jgi:hypothetical protein